MPRLTAAATTPDTSTSKIAAHDAWKVLRSAGEARADRMYSPAVLEPSAGTDRGHGMAAIAHSAW